MMITSTPTPAAVAAERERALRPWPRPRWRAVVTAAGVLLAIGWSLRGVQAQPALLVQGLPNIFDFITRMFPPAWKMIEVQLPVVHSPVVMPEVLFAIIETVQMAIVGTGAAVVMALPFGLLAARNTSPHPWVYTGVRLLLNAIRAIPELILALMFVAAVGLGPFSGVLALSFGVLGAMAKQYAEAIETIDPRQVQAITATGAGRLGTFVFAVIPQALPLVASFALLLFETNVRSATVLGLVGAGGVGFVLNKYMALFQYRELFGALLLIMIAVTALDRVSDAIRRRLI